MSNDQQQDLAERVSEPIVPPEVAKDIGVLEQQFIRAEVEQRKLILIRRVRARFYLAIQHLATNDLEDIYCTCMLTK